MEEWSEEDWMLATLRAEIHTILHAFRLDVNDEDRVSFPVIHFPYYYQLYTGKNFTATGNSFNCRTIEELTRIIPETCKHTASLDDFALRKESDPLISDYGLLFSSYDENSDMTVFIEVTEEARQNRTDRLDAGDENACLTFQYKAPVATAAANANFKRGGQDLSAYGAKRQNVGGRPAPVGYRR